MNHPYRFGQIDPFAAQAQARSQLLTPLQRTPAAVAEAPSGTLTYAGEQMRLLQTYRSLRSSLVTLINYLREDPSGTARPFEPLIASAREVAEDLKRYGRTREAQELYRLVQLAYEARGRVAITVRNEQLPIYPTAVVRHDENTARFHSEGPFSLMLNSSGGAWRVTVTIPNGEFVTINAPQTYILRTHSGFPGNDQMDLTGRWYWVTYRSPSGSTASGYMLEDDLLFRTA